MAKNGVSSGGVAAMVGVIACWSGAATADPVLDQLQREWWQWAMAIPASDNPILDKTGNRCWIAQRGDVWFLAGSTGGKVTRSCTVPANVKLLVPVVNTFCFPDASYSDDFCVKDTDDFIDGFVNGGTYTLEVDGRPVTPSDVRDETDFNFTVGSNGVFGVKPGLYRATIARGLWGLVGPLLPPGPHVIKVTA